MVCCKQDPMAGEIDLVLKQSHARGLWVLHANDQTYSIPFAVDTQLLPEIFGA